MGLRFPTAWLFTRLIIIGEDKPLLLRYGDTFLFGTNGCLYGLYTPGQGCTRYQRDDAVTSHTVFNIFCPLHDRRSLVVEGFHEAPRGAY